MLIFLFFYLSLLLWLIHPFLGWISLFITLIYFFKTKKQLNRCFIILCLFSSITFLASFENKDKTKDSYSGIVTNAKDNYFLFSSQFITYYVYQKEHEFEIGDILNIKGYHQNLSFTNLESEFDFEKFLKNQNVRYELKIDKLKIINKTFVRLNKLKKNILNNYQEKEAEYIETIIFSTYSQEIMQTGIFIIVTNSGLIFYSIISILKRILNRFFNDKITLIIIYILTFPFLLLTSFKIGILKAYIISINKDFKLKFNRGSIYNSLLIISLLNNPLYMLNASFYYTFLIPFFLPFLNETLACFSFKVKSLMKSIFFQIIYLPFTIYFQNEASFLGFIFIYLFHYFFGIMLLLTYILLLFPKLSFIISILAQIYFCIIKIVSKINIIFHFGYISDIFIFLVFILITLLLISFEKNNKKHGGLILFSLYTCILMNSSEILVEFKSYISFINVGQGDCALIHDKDINILIDVGGNLKKDIAINVLIPYFQKLGIRIINYIFLSHDDYDHSGALESLQNNFNVISYYKGSSFFKKKIKNLTFYNLNNFGSGDLENDDSSVIKLRFYNKTYLFCGDISERIEARILNQYDVKADIIKISHHGSSTASSFRFLKAVSPKEAVISVGKNNLYHHPNKEVLSRLNQLKIKIRRTDIEGSIIYNENCFSFFGLIYISLKSKKN